MGVKKKRGKFETFSHDTKRKILEKYNYACGLCKSNEVHSIHHKINNTRANRVKYGKSLQGEENGIPLCCNCHKPSKELNELRNQTTLPRS